MTVYCCGALHEGWVRTDNVPDWPGYYLGQKIMRGWFDREFVKISDCSARQKKVLWNWDNYISPDVELYNLRMREGVI